MAQRRAALCVVENAVQRKFYVGVLWHIDEDTMRPGGGVQRSEFALTRQHRTREQVLFDQIGVFPRGLAQIHENDALFIQFRIGFPMHQFAIHPGDETTLFITNQRGAVFRRDDIHRAAVGLRDDARRLPVDLTVIGAPPGFVFQSGHGQRFVDFPGLGAEFAQPVGFIL